MSAQTNLPLVLWEPSAQLIESSNLADFVAFLHKSGTKGVPTDKYYEALWHWSVSYVEQFWRKLAEWGKLDIGGLKTSVCSLDDVEHARWFEGATLNYAGEILRSGRQRTHRPAMFCAREDGTRYEISWSQLNAEVARVQGLLQEVGVGEGDRVVGFLSNTEHAVVCFLATAALGGIWSCCSPDFGAEAVQERFEQIEPTVFIACAGYEYGGKYLDKLAVITQIAQQLPSLDRRLLVDVYEAATVPEGWELYTQPAPNALLEPLVVAVPFQHPLWILFSSGTTGAPKAIVHGHGGCLLEHVKAHRLQGDVRAGEHFFWYTTTGWMMWNYLQASMLAGAIPVLYEGSPGYPDMMALWRLAEELPIHHFGTSAPFLHACLRKNLPVSSTVELAHLRSIGSTGAPLSEDGFAYVAEHVKSDAWLVSMSGGTDVCTAFVGGTPWKPVRRGVLQARALGADVDAVDGEGYSVIGTLGELVIRQPLPSMPLYFWGDTGGARRHESYFADLPGMWRHGDWITLDEEGGVVIHGRSDATLNRQGVRIGTAEIYRVVNAFVEVEDSLIINYVVAAGHDEMPLFVVLTPNSTLTSTLSQNLLHALREGASPRHVPTRVEAVADIPYTLSGKRLEAPVKRLFLGHALGDVAKPGALRNPAALQAFADLAARETSRT